MMVRQEKMKRDEAIDEDIERGISSISSTSELEEMKSSRSL